MLNMSVTKNVIHMTTCSLKFMVRYPLNDMFFCLVMVVQSFQSNSFQFFFMVSLR